MWLIIQSKENKCRVYSWVKYVGILVVILISLSFYFPVCVNVTYLVHDYGMSFTVTVNKHTIFNETVSGKYILCVCSESLQLVIVTICFPWHSRIYFLINILHGAQSFFNEFTASQETTHILWNPKVHYRIRKCPPHVPILSQFNPVHDAPHSLS